MRGWDWKRIIPLAALLSSLSWETSAAPAIEASFDCAAAKAPIEKVICSDARLADLDKEMAEAYFRYRSIAGTYSRERELKKQRSFLADRLRRCDLPKAADKGDANQNRAVQCLTGMYMERLVELRELVDAERGIKKPAIGHAAATPTPEQPGAPKATSSLTAGSTAVRSGMPAVAETAVKQEAEAGADREAAKQQVSDASAAQKQEMDPLIAKIRNLKKGETMHFAVTGFNFVADDLYHRATIINHIITFHMNPEHPDYQEMMDLQQEKVIHLAVQPHNASCLEAVGINPLKDQRYADSPIDTDDTVSSVFFQTVPDSIKNRPDDVNLFVIKSALCSDENILSFSGVFHIEIINDGARELRRYNTCTTGKFGGCHTNTFKHEATLIPVASADDARSYSKRPLKRTPNQIACSGTKSSQPWRTSFANCTDRKKVIQLFKEAAQKLRKQNHPLEHLCWDGARTVEEMHSSLSVENVVRTYINSCNYALQQLD